MRSSPFSPCSFIEQKLKAGFSVFAEEEDFTSTLRDRSHIDETLRLATEEKSRDYAGDGQEGCLLISFQMIILRGGGYESS